MARIELFCIIEGVPAGLLWQDAAGLIFFRYADGYQGIPLSLSMPITNRTYGQKVVSPYLFGLLPDREEQRRAMAQEYGGRPNNAVALLAHIGMDCPGAVQFCHADEGSLTNVLTRPGSYERLAEHEMALRLKELRLSADDSWLAEGEHWSLGGNQGKLALALRDGAWCSCQGAAATTHIFKNGVVGYRLQALNEYVCMRTATECCIDAAHVSYDHFEDEPALIVERYDRKEEDGIVARYHYEDLCQSLSVMPSMKYTADGGPTTYDVLRLLASTGADAARNLVAFTRQLFFNCLIGAPDAHAKNYSLRLGPQGSATLAPMYDVASALAYEGMARTGRLAMAIGGENRFGRVGSDAIGCYATGGNDIVKASMEAAGLDAAGCVDIMGHLAERVPQRMERVFEQNAHVPGMDELREHLLGPVTRNCAQTLALLG